LTTPKASIVIRTLNESKNLEKLLKGVHEQAFKDWEIVLVDSGSTDGTVDIARRYGANIYHIPKDEFTFGRSLNQGCSEAKGEILVFVSGHVWPITNNWLGNLVKPFEESAVAMVYGRQRGTEASRLSELRDLESQFGPGSHIMVDEPRGNNGNAAIRRDLWLEQPFDETLPGLEDVDWARKIGNDGHRVYYAADAAVYHLHKENLKQIYGRYLREAIASKRMFPHNRFSWLDMAKGLPDFILRDLMFALRRRMPLKALQAPGARLAQLLGIYRGIRRHQRLSKNIARQLSVPPSYQRVVSDGPGSHSLQQTELRPLNPEEVLIQVAFADASAAGSSEAHCNGHAFSGVVVHQGSDSGRLKTGQKVAGAMVASNGHSGDTDASEMFSTCAEYLIRTANDLHEIPMDLPLKLGALVSSVAVCSEGIDRLYVDYLQSACVIGAGSRGNLCAQILRSLGLHVTVVDDEARWLSVLHKYDINTLDHIDGLESFDYVVETTGEPEMAARIIEGASAKAKILFLTPSHDLPSDDSRVVSGSSIASGPNWEKAIFYIREGIIRLEEHTATVEVLENYQKALDRLDCKKSFTVLINPSKDLGAL